MTNEYVAATSINWIDDITAGDIYAVLTYTNSPDTHYTDWEFYDDVTGELGTAGGYTAGGLALTSGTVAMVTDTDRYVRYDAGDLVWSSPFTAGPFRWIIFFKDSGTASTSPLIGWHNMGADTTGAGGAFTYTFDSNGGVFRSKVPHP
jgi:hypothetical protein